MKRDLNEMARISYDILVIGGGIYGTCVAWDAALRGLSVALVEQNDFGSSTSANTLKIFHGGLRYLQEASLPRMRLMVRERRAWQRIAPHLTRPLPCVLPTGAKLTRRKSLMMVALAINDLVSFDRNRGVPPYQSLSRGRILSRAECLTMAPGLPPQGVTGGALWHDVQLLNSERLLFSLLTAATEHGAYLANYAQAIAWRREGRSLQGVTVRDLLTGRDYNLSAPVVINCSGGWSDGLLAQLNEPKMARTFHLSTAVNLITRQLLPDIALGLPSHHAGRERILFVAPWQEYSLIGTWHQPYPTCVPDYQLDQATIQTYLDEVNTAYPRANLRLSDVHHIHVGYLPMQPSSSGGGVPLVRESIVHDHTIRDGLEGLITVIGVKYTTARHTAEQAVDLALRKLTRPHVPCQTARTSLADTAPALHQSAHSKNGRQTACTRLSQEYGAATPRLLRLLDENPGLADPIVPNAPVMKAEIVYGVRYEMAQTLADVVQRRTQLGAAGLPDQDVASACANVMAQELGWSPIRQAQEVDALYDSYAKINPLTASGPSKSGVYRD